LTKGLKRSESKEPIRGKVEEVNNVRFGTLNQEKGARWTPKELKKNRDATLTGQEKGMSGKVGARSPL